MLPPKLKNFRVFNDGEDYLGRVSEIELPKLKMASEEYRGGGHLAAVDIDLGLEKLELTSTYGGLVVGVLRQFGLTLSQNPYVYFQDDDDPLPKGLETRIKLMRREPYDVIFGVTETRTARGQMIERFPTLDANGRPMYDLAEGIKLFPTYVHPCAALYRREALEKIKIDDGHDYNICGIGAFLTRFINEGSLVQALPDIMRIGQQNRDNMSEPILDQKQRLLLAEDIRVWQKYINDPVVRAFQEEIRQDLIRGEIITFRDITARVESRLEEDGFYLDDVM